MKEIKTIEGAVGWVMLNQATLVIQEHLRYSDQGRPLRLGDLN